MSLYYGLKHVKILKSSLTSMKNIMSQEPSKLWILQLLTALSAGLTSFLSLDSKSRKWIQSIENERQKQLAEGLAIHPASFCQGLIIYIFAHFSLLIKMIQLKKSNF